MPRQGKRKIEFEIMKLGDEKYEIHKYLESTKSVALFLVVLSLALQLFGLTYIALVVNIILTGIAIYLLLLFFKLKDIEKREKELLEKLKDKNR